MSKAEAVRENRRIDELAFGEVESVMAHLEGVNRRATSATKRLREINAEPHLAKATAHFQDDLRKALRRYIQRTYFAVPNAEAEGK